ncbi:Mo-nitrogenase MoFe protein subunit NifD precursor [Dethiosulfatibacter aminovorans DSM 17477]|uniref:Nitrogenase protein alpha chain n=1 Tax=Dethiosulfatibacter aminovorans DSM 17477 TaxID=1121476 RepID=A0A1M6CCN6_9FIRM|nr:nitrogenase molybdenum-iron protein alpha chain [Dethiosulfatibacter aminovorans]SHI58757.1 Mo-nitrogenase MoFe protein subunit NifD precursor [Dethiosulfatibacter aminovorans DSM 17477]
MSELKKNADKFLDDLMEVYPAKVMKNRKKHVVVKEGAGQEIAANTRTVPGIITNRGCCYAGCKGVVIGPIVDMVHIVHGPVGCAYYAWGTRRNKGKAREGGQNFLNYCFTTDMQESDIVFGGEKKLKKAIEEAVELFQPKAISISATCPVGLIGDDIDAVAREMSEKTGVKILSFNCEGYKGVSQSAGHHIANNKLMKEVVGTNDSPVGKFSINLLGEYNIGGDEWEISRVLSKIGYNLVTTMTGNSTIDEIANAHKSDLNVVQCHRSINYIADMIEEKYGLNWLKGNFIGVENFSKTLRNIARYFGDEGLIARTEEVIAEEVAEIKDTLNSAKEKLNGKTAVLYVGGSRADHYQGLLREIGIETIVAGYEFGHRDDYEGRDVIPYIKLDADTRNIEEITVEKDEKNYSLRIPADKVDELKKEMPIADYEGLMKNMADGSLIIDDLNHYETEKIIEILKPEFFGSGIKDKYIVHKMGTYSKQMHSYDYAGPYAGFKGAANFAKDVEAGILTPAWSYLTPPWNKEPLLKGKVEGVEEAC